MKTIILILASFAAYSQVTTPPIRINEKVYRDTEVALCNNDSTMFFSFLQLKDSVCVQQDIAFLDVTQEWVVAFVIKEMGFSIGDTSLIKEIPTGFMSAQVKQSVVMYHGEQQASTLVISLYEWRREDD